MTPTVLAVVMALTATASVLSWPQRPSPPPTAAPPGADRDVMGSDWPWASVRKGWWGQRVRDDAAARLAAMVELIASGMLAGLTTGDAVGLALRTAPPGPDFADVTGHLERARRRHEPLAPVWAAAAERHETPILRRVARAWALSEDLGVPLGPALTSVVGVSRDASMANRRREALAAGPKTSMALLTGLPIVGPALGAVFGVDPVAVYLGQPVCTVSLATGLGLTALGWGWSRRMLERSSRPSAW